MVAGQPYLNFSSNDYLGMSQEPAVLQAWVEGLEKYGAGSGASPLVTGHTQGHLGLESYLATHLNRDAVLLFSSGFAANQAVCQGLGLGGVDFIADKLAHASLIDGALNAKQHGAQFRRFKHNDMAHLERQLNACQGDKIVISEGVFSMDGDQGNIQEIVHLSSQHGASVMLDDAHGMGVLGNKGLGTIEQMQLGQDDVPIVMGTFGKGIGTAGAFVAGSSAFINYLMNVGRHYIYSTMMPPAQAVATLESLTFLSQDNQKQAQLFENICLFRQGAAALGVNLLESHTAIQPVLFDNSIEVTQVSAKLKQLGLWVTPIRPPTVPIGADRLRITLSALHTSRDIQALLDGLAVALDKA